MRGARTLLSFSSALIALFLCLAIPVASFELTAHEHAPAAPAGSGVSAGPLTTDDSGHPCPICRLAHETAAPSIVVFASTPGSVDAPAPLAPTLQFEFLPPRAGPARAPPAIPTC